MARLIESFFDEKLLAHIGANQLGDRFSRYTLLGTQLNIAMDLPAGKIPAEATVLIKQISGGDWVFIEPKGANGRSAHLYCQFLFGTNHQFVHTTKDEAFLNRIVLVPFQFPMPVEIRNVGLLEKLLVEREAILNRALEVFNRFQTNNYRFTGEEQFGIRVAGMCDTAKAPLLDKFIRERCIQTPEGCTPTRELFAAYIDFLTQHGEEVCCNSQQFSKSFNEATPSTVFHDKKRFGGPPQNCYCGVKIKEETVQ